MAEFSLSSKYLKNLKSVVEKLSSYKENKCTIVVNKTFRIELPVVVAASLSSKITKMIENDPTQTVFPFTVDAKKDNGDSFDKIRRVLIDNTKVSLNDEDIKTFAAFGLEIGNDDFITPLSEKYKKASESLDKENVVSILNTKGLFGIKDTQKETTFIASNFIEMSTNEEFISFAKNAENIPVINEILHSSSLLVEDEDSLLSFLLTISKSDMSESRFIALFENVFLEYCSVPKCKEFIEFVNERCQTQEMKTLVSCIGRRFLQPKLPMDPDFIKSRHLAKYTEITMDDPLNGILRREYLKNNALMEASTIYNGDVYDLLKCDTSLDFYTINSSNSFIKASLKNGKSFVLKSYMIRARKYENCGILNNWKLEGQKESSDEWILLDSHSNEKFSALQVKTFNVSCKEKLKALKLTQTGKNSSGAEYLMINAFDIFGNLYDN